MNGAGQCTIRIGTQSTGQGHETAFAQMTSARPPGGVPVASVTVLQGGEHGRGGESAAGGTSTADYVQGLSEVGLRNKLRD